jgi:predicted RNA-binding protein YlqC (UPF0109 family)
MLDPFFRGRGKSYYRGVETRICSILHTFIGRQPGRSVLQETTAGDVTRLSLTVDPDDLDKIIEKPGMMARSIRTIWEG